MAQDRIASIVRAMVGVPQERLPVLQKVVNNLNSVAPHGDQFQVDLSGFVLGWEPVVVVPVPAVPDLARWGKNYEMLFGKTPDLSGIRIPAKPEGVGPVRLIVVAQELMEWTGNCPLQGTQDALKKHFACWQYESKLDEAIPTNDRHPKNGSYAVWIEDEQESYECYANKSANDLEVEGHVGPTVLECQFHELDYFMATGKHLDVKNVRSATGPRGRYGDVPNASWSDRFRVYWYYASARDPSLRSRRVWA